jgi:hypothetical protein
VTLHALLLASERDSLTIISGWSSMKPLIFEAAGFLFKADNIANWKRSMRDRREQSLVLAGPEHTSIDDL